MALSGLPKISAGFFYQSLNRFIDIKHFFVVISKIQIFEVKDIPRYSLTDQFTIFFSIRIKQISPDKNINFHSALVSIEYRLTVLLLPFATGCRLIAKLLLNCEPPTEDFHLIS